MASPSPALAKPQIGQPCPCGSGKHFEDCCAPLLANSRPAATAEELMRSRFTAHVAQHYRHLHRTYLPTANLPYVEEADDAAPMGWSRLTVHSHEPGNSPDQAFVEFSAYYEENKVEHVLQERSEFRRIKGEWFFSRTVRQGPAPFKTAQPKPGRNDPCPCGSGKKHKHCCGRV